MSLRTTIARETAFQVLRRTRKTCFPQHVQLTEPLDYLIPTRNRLGRQFTLRHFSAGYPQPARAIVSKEVVHEIGRDPPAAEETASTSISKSNSSRQIVAGVTMRTGDARNP